MQKSPSIPYNVRSFNKLTNSWVVRGVATVEEAVSLGKHLASLPSMKFTSWGWSNRELEIVDVGTIPVV